MKVLHIPKFKVGDVVSFRGIELNVSLTIIGLRDDIRYIYSVNKGTINATTNWAYISYFDQFYDIRGSR